MRGSVLRLSRWGKASYETTESIAAQRKALFAWVKLVPDHTDAEIVVVHSKMRIDLEALDQMPSARLVITTTSGYEHMDIPALHVRGYGRFECLCSVEMRLWTPHLG